jgi:hypothetical protein
MTWIGKTILASETDLNKTDEIPNLLIANNDNKLSVQELPDFIHHLLSSGVPLGAIQAWMQKVDLTAVDDLNESFKMFALS